MRNRLMLWPFLVLLVALAACTPVPDLKLTLSAGSVTVDQGGNGAVQVTFQRTNLEDPISLSVEGLPAGVTGDFSPNPAPKDATTLTLTAGVGVAPGEYTLKVKAAAPGITREASLTLKVVLADFSLSPASPGISINQGASGTVAVNINRANLAGDVSLAVEGTPAGVSATFDPNPASAASSLLTLTVAEGVTAGQYSLTLKGTAGGRVKTASLGLTVNPKPDFGLSLEPASVSLKPTQTKDVAVTITRTNFTGEVSLSLEGAPEGVTGSFSPSVTSGGSSTLTLSVGNTVAAGDYTLTVRAAATSFNRTASLNLRVEPAQSTAVTVRTLINGTQQNATWAAYQDGGGAWKPLSGTGGSYSFDVTDPAGRYGVVFVCPANPSGTATWVSVYQFTVRETTNFRVTCGSYYGPGSPSSGSLTLSGTVGGLSGSATASISLGAGHIATANESNPQYAIGGLSAGTYDLIATRYPSGIPGEAPDKLIFLRDLTVDTNTVRDLNFEGPEAFSLEGSYTASLQGGPSDYFAASYTTGTPGVGSAFALGGGPGVSAFTYQAVPANKTKPTDFYVFAASSGGYFTRVAKLALKTPTTPQDVVLSFPDDMTATFDYGQTTPYLRPRVNWSTTGKVQAFAVAYVQSDGVNSLSWNHVVSPGWLGNSREYTSPDFSAASGWQDAWALQEGMSAEWAIGYVNSNTSMDLALSALSNTAPDANADFRNIEIQVYRRSSNSLLP